MRIHSFLTFGKCQKIHVKQGHRQVFGIGEAVADPEVNVCVSFEFEGRRERVKLRIHLNELLTPDFEYEIHHLATTWHKCWKKTGRQKRYFYLKLGAEESSKAFVDTLEVVLSKLNRCFTRQSPKSDFFLIAYKATNCNLGRLQDLLTSFSNQSHGTINTRVKEMGVSKQGVEEDASGMVEKLNQAIRLGKDDEACQLVRSMCHMTKKPHIQLAEESDPSEGEFSIKVCIEDAEKEQGNIEMKVRPSWTVMKLKKEMQSKHNIPTAVQRWLQGNTLLRDEEVLGKHHVQSDSLLYLYIVSSGAAGLKRRLPERELERGLSEMAVEHRNHGAVTPRPHSFDRNSYVTMNSPLLSEGGLSFQQAMLRSKSQESWKSHSGSSHGQGLGTAATLPPNIGRAPKEEGWTCTRCTLFNTPTRPGCAACGENRPAGYCIPHGYIMTPDERKRIHKERQHEEIMHQQEERERQQNFAALQKAENSPLVTNATSFDCPICFDHVDIGQGVMLRDCLHMFCKGCLADHVKHSGEADLVCPYQDDEYACNRHLQEREVKAIVSPELYAKYLERSLSTAEAQERNSFHCKTTDCRGWCIYEDMINFFTCPICLKENCLTCKAIHTGMDCKEYQEDLKLRAQNDKDARESQCMLDQMVKDGLAMHCPGCNIIIQKKEGCDWLRCSICKMEICWVTKKPRWGPKGNGDNSGGCGCRVNGQRCHPNCQNCH